MKYIRRESLSWRKLDNYAKLFPLAATENYKIGFRMSVVLNENIDPVILEKSVKIALNKFKYYKVRIRKGIFWYYFETNNKLPLVEEENDYPCRAIDLPLNNDYLFKVTYFEKKINLEIFHCLTDGNGAMSFFKEIIYTYIDHKYEKTSASILSKERESRFNAEDSYTKNYDKNIKVKRDRSIAYTLRGRILPPGVVRATHEYMSCSKLKEISKSKGASITQFLAAALIYSIHEVGVKQDKSKREVKIQVPVNLKKYFPSETLANFFSYIDVNVDTNKEETFENILETVKNEFKTKLTEDELKKTIAVNLKLSNNFFLKLVPLFIKKLVVQNAHKEYRKYNTTTLSNMGMIDILPEYKEYIDKFLLLIAPEVVEKIKCTIIAYEEIMVFSFASVLENTKVEEKFKEVLESYGLNVTTEGNEV